MSIVFRASDDFQKAARLPRERRAAVKCQTTDGKIVVFLNGEVVGSSSVQTWERLKHSVKGLTASLSSNSERLGAPIKGRRMFILNNTLGFHARDIFEESIPGTKYTRSFLRTVAREGIEIGRRSTSSDAA